MEVEGEGLRGQGNKSAPEGLRGALPLLKLPALVGVGVP